MTNGTDPVVDLRLSSLEDSARRLDRKLANADKQLTLAQIQQLFIYIGIPVGIASGIFGTALWIVIESSAREVAEDVAKTSASTKAAEVAGKTALEVAKSTATSVASKISIDTATNTAKDVSAEVASDTARNVARTVSKNVAEEAAEVTADRISRDVASRISREIATSIAESVSTTIANNKSTEIAREVAKREARLIAAEIAREEARDAATYVRAASVANLLLDNEEFKADLSSGALEAFRGSVVAFANKCPSPGWSPYKKAYGRFIIGAADENETKEIPTGFTMDSQKKKIEHRILDSIGGSQEHKLTDGEMPSHSHGLPKDPVKDLEGPPQPKHNGINLASNAATIDEGFKAGPKGGSDPHNNMPPYIALYFCKKD